MAANQATHDENLTFQFLYLDTLRKMRDSEANQDDHKYYTYFKFALQMGMGYLDVSQREKIETDHKKMQQDTAILISADGKNVETKKFEINMLKLHFAETHEYYLMAALQRLGIVKIMDDGLIDFEKEDIGTLKKIVREGSGLPTAIKRVLDDGKGKEEKPKQG